MDGSLVGRVLPQGLDRAAPPLRLQPLLVLGGAAVGRVARGNFGFSCAFGSRAAESRSRASSRLRIWLEKRCCAKK